MFYVFFLLLAAVCFLEFSKSGASPLVNLIAALFSTLFIASSIYFVWLATNISATYFYIIAAICLIAVIYFRAAEYKEVLKRLSFAPSWTSIIFLIGLVIIMPKLSAHISNWGRWDAVAIWNLHAKFLFHTSLWTSYLRADMEWTHPDYPLFLPASIAFFWKTQGSIDSLIPFLLSLFFTLSIPIVLFSALPKHTFSQKIIAVSTPLLLLSNDTYLKWFLAQMADAPLSLAYLLAFVYLRIFEVSRNNGALFIAATLVSASVWIKNEGVVFLISFLLIVFIYQSRSDWRYLVRMTVVVTVTLFIPMYFKVFFAPTNDLVSAFNFQDLTMKFMDFSRYKLIIKHSFGALKSSDLYLLLLIPSVFVLTNWKVRELLFSLSFKALLLCSVFYFFIYLFTPKELNWHLETSSVRLLLHIIPSFCFILFSIFGHKKQETIKY
jgi:hypothetical protein